MIDTDERVQELSRRYAAGEALFMEGEQWVPKLKVVPSRKAIAAELTESDEDEEG